MVVWFIYPVLPRLSSSSVIFKTQRWCQRHQMAHCSRERKAAEATGVLQHAVEQRRREPLRQPTSRPPSRQPGGCHARWIQEVEFPCAVMTARPVWTFGVGTANIPRREGRVSGARIRGWLDRDAW